MRTRDKAILVALPLVVLAGAFWFLLLSPKREEASKLGDEVSQLQAAVAEQEALVSAADEARKSFPRNYRKVVVLGKAVPEDADTPSFLVQLGRLAAESGVQFTAVRLDEDAANADPTAAETSAPSSPTTPPAGDVPGAESAGSGTATSAAATESGAATLPLGAAVGPAGLPVMPYELEFSGDFFGVAKFISKLNGLVGLHRNGSPQVFGRLITIDGFQLTPPVDTSSATGASTSPSTELDASFTVTTYVTPESEGATAGATPSGPETGIEPIEAATPSATEPAPAPPTASAGAGVTP